MNEDVPPKDHKNALNNELPPTGKTVRVLHEGRERMAYLDKSGEWRNHLLGHVLDGEVKILPPRDP